MPVGHAGVPGRGDRARPERITQAKLLVRMDAGNDDVENITVCRKAQGGLDHQAEPAEGIAGGLAGGGPGPRRLGRTAGRQGGLHGRDLAGAGRQAVTRGVRGDPADDHGRRAEAVGAGHRGGHVVDEPEAAGRRTGDRACITSTARASSFIRRSRRTWTWSGCPAGSSPPTP